MNWFADIALQIWPPVVLVLFLVMPARRAVVGALIASWLFLPQHFIEVTFVPNLTKVSATSYAVLFGALLLDPRRTVFNFRPVWTDIPMGLFMFSAFLSSLFNGLGTYDAFSMLLDRFVQYGIPYLMGRSYFQTAADCKELCLGILLGGLVYVPLCAYEVRMSPQLHAMFYGAAPFSDFKMARRWGGFRPTVFMQHGLMVGVWMATACATSFWLWRTRSVEKFLWLPMWMIFWGLFITTVLVKATGAIVLLLGVIAIMYCLINFRSKIPFAAVLVVIPSYLFIRTTGLWDGIAFSEWLGTQVSPDRAASLWYRLTMENETVGRMTNRGMFGWGGWGRAFDYTFDLKGVPTLIVPDSFWIVTFGSNGYYGLITVFTFYLLGPTVLLIKLTHREWADPRYAPITGIAVVSLLYALDCLFNAMVNPIFIVMLGAVTGMAARLERKTSSTAGPALAAARPEAKPAVRTAATAPAARTAPAASARYLPPGRPRPSEGRP